MKTITTNELKKGALVSLRNGRKAKIEDNMKGNTRLCTVYGDFIEMGSVYAHDIEFAVQNDENFYVQHTDKQNKLRATVGNLFR